ncbi:MAG: pirin family protein [Planctomycetes bacterium]|nr:pirin family protein [Planctomycetota bacterium]
MGTTSSHPPATPGTLTIRRAGERGHADHGWLDSWHSFSFASYDDPRHMGFRSLRVINDDRVAAGRGFGMHPHEDMEIITYVLDGELAHKDSLGNGSLIRPGDVQRMSAGTGITHSEFNPSPSTAVRLLQIWIEPARVGVAPSYEQKFFPRADREHRLRLIASPDGRDGSVTINQDACVYAGILSAGDRAAHRVAAGRHAWIQVARGAIALDGQPLVEGDAASLSGAAGLEFTASEDAELLVFDLG